MKLIDADELLKLIKEQKIKETGAYAKGLNAGLNIVKSIVNDETQTPTAYDMDEVVEQLRAWTFNADVSTNDYEQKNCNLIESTNAIEIVKAGGIDGKSE